MPGFIDWLDTPAGRVPRISGKLSFSDHLGACRARWGIGRMSYIVPPGLYAMGTPAPDSPVLVTANYKMTYDIVRRALTGRSIWLLVLETYGINVWCAAGKGTFGTGEVVRRVASTALADVVSHRRLILPIMGAPGVAAHQVAARSGFSVSYAAIFAEDLPEYLDNGMITTPAMRRLRFSLYDRLVLIPVEVVLELKSLAVLSLIVLAAATALGSVAAGGAALIACAGAVLSGTVLGPLLLPWLPGRSFAVKGVQAGIIWAASFLLLFTDHPPLAVTLAALLILPAVSAFYTLSFTGCSTFTSRSGVKREMRYGLPLMGGAVLLGCVLLILERIWWGRGI